MASTGLLFTLCNSAALRAEVKPAAIGGCIQNLSGGRGGPANPFTNQNNPYVLWDAMIKPIQPYAIKGALWYQGESITEAPCTIRCGWKAHRSASSSPSRRATPRSDCTGAPPGSTHNSRSGSRRRDTSGRAATAPPGPGAVGNTGASTTPARCSRPRAAPPVRASRGTDRRTAADEELRPGLLVEP
jgi:hypothetical protein